METSARPTTRQVLLGLFVAGQIVFIFGSNLVNYVQYLRSELTSDQSAALEALAPGWPGERGHVQHGLATFSRVSKMWAQASGQDQSWSLFAPHVNRTVSFMSLEVRLEGEAAPWWLHSVNEPTDVHAYFRWGGARLRKYETNLALNLWAYDDESDSARARRWNQRARSYLDDYGTMLEGYMWWRLSGQLPSSPSKARPVEVVLWLRRYDTLARDDAPPYWRGPSAIPLARWRLTPNAGPGPLQPFDHLARQFKDDP